MYILNEKIKNKSSTYFLAKNLEIKSLDTSILKKRSLKMGELKHFPSPTKEWYNSVYNFTKNSFIITLPLKDKILYKLFDLYFNLNKLDYYKYNSLAMSNIFIGKPEVKHFNNKINITIYIFNKWITYFHNVTKTTKIRKFVKILFSHVNKSLLMLKNKLFVITTLLLKHSRFDQRLTVFFRRFLLKMFCYHINNKYNSINTRFIMALHRYIYSFFDYIKFTKLVNLVKITLFYSKEDKKINNLRIILQKLRLIYFTKLNINSLGLLIKLISFYFMIKKLLKTIYILEEYRKNIYFSKYKFNVKNILVLKSFLNKLYNKKIEINIINLKYLYMDGNILALAVAKKLKDRKVRILRVIRMALRLSKKPYFNKFYSNFLRFNNLDNMFIRKDLNLSINKNIPFNKDVISKPISYKSRIIFYYLKHKIVCGMKLQGAGRLTKRLTASRSISKYINKGSLKNKVSSYNGISTVVLRGYVKSNLQYVNVSSYNRIGAYGIKSWVSNF